MSGRTRRQIPVFLFVGLTGFLIDTGFTLLLIRVGFSPVPARAPGLTLSVLVTWYLNRRWTFGVVGRKNGAADLLRYLVIVILASFVNYTVYVMLLARTVGPLPAIALATATSMLLSFFGYRTYAFRRR